MVVFFHSPIVKKHILKANANQNIAIECRFNAEKNERISVVSMVNVPIITKNFGKKSFWALFFVKKFHCCVAANLFMRLEYGLVQVFCLGYAGAYFDFAAKCAWRLCGC